MSPAGRTCRSALAFLLLLSLSFTAAGAEQAAVITQVSSAAGTLAETPSPAAASPPSLPPGKQGEAPTTPGTPAPEAAAEAPAAPKPIPVTLIVDIDLAAQRMVVKAHGKPIHTWTVSSGTREFPTPTGTFRPQWMAKMWFSRKYDDAPMPHSIFFKDGAAIHGTQSISRLGSAASHGCVRLAPSNAAALYALVTKHGMASTRIAVHGTPKWREPAVASRSSGATSVREGRVPFPRASAGYTPGYAYAPVSAPPPGQFIYPGDAPPRFLVQRRPIYFNAGRSPYSRF
jgi:lipoprotein-anchoring transpeptidase ErfK/SrfK